MNSILTPTFKEKYYDIARREGVNAALTQLHADVERLENDTFESEGGYKPTQFRELIDVREFSRELWAMALENPETVELRDSRKNVFKSSSF